MSSLRIVRRSILCWVVAGSLAAGLLSGCDQFNLYNKFTPSGSRPAQPLAISPSLVAVQVAGTVSFTATGGVPPYAFSLAAGNGTINPTSGLYTAPYVAGSAAITVRDASGSTSVASVTIAATAALAISPTALTIGTGGAYQFSASGGVAPYTFSLYSGSGSVTAAGLYTAPTSSGTDDVRVTDAAGSISDASVTIVATGTLSLSPVSPAIPEGGAITFVGAGGTPPYSYSLTAGAGSIVSSLSGGAYSAPATAASGTVGKNLATITITDSASPTPASVSTQVTIVPAAPSNLTASTPANKQIQLTWANNSLSTSVTGIEVWRQTGGTGAFTLVATLAPTAASYLDIGLSPNTLYTYYVQAVDSSISPAPAWPDSNLAYAIS